MDEREVMAALRQYIATEILEGDDEGLDTQTPLLQWGIVNSMEMTRLRGFIERQFQISIAAADVSAENFKCIADIAALVVGRERVN
jgi:acyl carrier protein